MYHMKRIIYFIFSFFCGVTLFAQESKQGEFLFDQYMDSFVHYKDGQVFAAKVNYSYMKNKYVFLDAFDGNKVKHFAEPEKINFIRIGERIFLIGEKEMAKELICSEPTLYVTYQAELSEGKKVGYGGRSQTTAVRTYSSFHANGQKYHFEEEGAEVRSITHKYTLVKKKKSRKFINKHQFLKIYPKDKRGQIESYIHENHIHLNEPAAVVKLVQFSERIN